MPERARILVVDDESSVRLVLSDQLSRAGYEVSTAASGEEALGRLQDATFDLMLLDLKMPGIDGLQVMEEATGLAPDMVVIMLTAYASLDSAVQAMRHGGHDYLLKPASTEELLASVEKGLAKRRKRLRQGELIRQIQDTALQLTTEEMKATEQQEPDEQRPRFLRMRELLLDRERLAITMRGRPVDLTPTEFKLLLCLMENAGRTVSFAQMSEGIHGVETHEILARSAISTHIWRLRGKLKEAAPEEAYIVNVRGRGYRLSGD